MEARKTQGTPHTSRYATDIRSAYTALSIATLLDLRTDELVKGTTEWLVSCQTFEGGMAGSPTSAEAHGGYAFCILAALCILHPPTELPKLLDMDNLTVRESQDISDLRRDGWLCNKLRKEDLPDGLINWSMLVIPGG